MSQINDVLSDLRSLYLAESDPAKRQALQQQYEEALDAALDIVDKNIGNNTAAYQAAVQKLEDAVTALQSAKKSLGDVSGAITKMATVIDEFVKIAAVIAAAA